MKYLKKCVAFILALALTFQVNPGSINAKETEIPQTQSAGKIRNMYNMAIPIRFDGENEYVNDTISEADNITNIQLIDNTYNKSVYSVQAYYEAVSNHTLNLKTVYLTEEKNGFASIKLNNSRGYYSPKTEENPFGYTTENCEYRKSELLRDWTEKVKEAVNNGAKLKNITGEEIDFTNLDSDGDGIIDCITLLFTPTDAKYAAEWNSPLWAFQSENYLLNIETSKGTLTSKKYYQAPIQNEPLNICKENNSNIYFSNTKTLIHEMGHIFGLLDLYPFSGNNNPVYFMSSMSKALSPVVQFMTTREREAAGWLDKDNITPITKAGTYTLPPVKDEHQDGIISYTLELPNNRKLYLEYRYVDDKDVNRFDLNGTKRNLYNALGNPTGNGGLNKSGLLVYDTDMSRKFPSNSSGTPQLSVIGGQYDTKIDAPRTAGESITYGGYKISVTELTKEKITFDVSGKDLDEEHPDQPGNEDKPTANGITLLAPSGISENLQLTAARGSEIQFLAQTASKKFSDKDILWSVKGETADDTKIDVKTGLLKIGNFESPEGTIKVIGRSDEDTTKSIEINVKVTLGTKTYSVTYLPGENSAGKIESTQKIHDENLTLKGALYTKAGFVQTGWSLSEDGEKVYDLNSSFNKNNSVMLYPYWTSSNTPATPVTPEASAAPTSSASVNPSVAPTSSVSPKPSDDPSAGSGGSSTGSGGSSAGSGGSSTGSGGSSAGSGGSSAGSGGSSAGSGGSSAGSGGSSAGSGDSSAGSGGSSAGSGGSSAGSGSSTDSKPSMTPTVSASPKPSVTPAVSASPKPSVAPAVSASPKPSVTPAVSVTPELTAAPTTPPQITASPDPKITLNATSLVLDTGASNTGKITATVEGSDKNIIFKSSNPQIVKVDKNGNLTALKAGTVNISVYANGTTAFCKVVVKKASIKLNHKSIVLFLSKSKTTKLNAKISGVSSKIVFKSKNPDIVKVNANGKLTALKQGITTVTVTANGQTATCRVKVRKISLSLNLTKATISLKRKNSFYIKPAIVGPNKKAKYKSSNPSILKVSNTGKVVAIRKGTANIIVIANGKRKRCKVHVI